MGSSGKLKVLIVGCGVISVHWFEYTLGRGDCEIAGIVDRNAAAAEEKRKKYGLSCPIFLGLEDGLRGTKPDIVYDLTYVTTHIDVVARSLEAGCHVFGEKPMTLTREDARTLLGVAERTGKSYSVMQNRRYQKPVQAIRELVASGRLGRLWMVSADIFVREDLSSIRNTLEKPMLQDNAIHTFDQVRFLTGLDPSTVYCHSYNPPESKYKGDAAGACIFEMSDGSVFVYNCTMGTEGCTTSWESSWRVSGSKGTVVWDGAGAPHAEVRKVGPEREYDTFEPRTAWNGKTQHFGCLDEMYDALLAGRPSQTDCHDNYKSISMAFSSIDSARLGGKVKVG